MLKMIKGIVRDVLPLRFESAPDGYVKKMYILHGEDRKVYVSFTLECNDEGKVDRQTCIHERSFRRKPELTLIKTDRGIFLATIWLE
jgi:hypothetical protein